MPKDLMVSPETSVDVVMPKAPPVELIMMCLCFAVKKEQASVIYIRDSSVRGAV